MFRCSPVLLFACVAAAVPARAGLWTPLGPDGGRVFAIATAPSRPEVVYAGGAAVFRSDDGGLHWSAAAYPFPSTGPRAAPARVTALAVSPLDPDRVLLASPQGLFRTEDGGASWARAGTIAGSVSAVAFNAGAAAASVPGAVYHSEDGGATWSSAPAPAMAAICEDPRGTQSFYAALAAPDAEGRSLYRTTDGLHWTPLPLAGLAPTAIRPAPDGDRLYAAVSGPGGGVFRLPPDGTEAARISDTPSFALAIYDTGAVWVFCATEPGAGAAPVYRTPNDGARWDALTRSFGTHRAWALALGPNITPLAGTDGAGVLAYDGTDETWKRRSSGLRLAAVAGMYQKPDGSLTLAATPDGLWRSTNDGAVWMRHRSPGPRPLLAASAAKPGRVWHAGASGLERSEDYGNTWLTQTSGLPSKAEVACVLPHPHLPHTVWAVLADGAVYRSTTSITSWKRILSPFPTPPTEAPALAYAPSKPEVLYTVRPDGFHRSTDSGGTWSLRSDTDAGARLAVDPADPETVYRAENAGGAVSVGISTDGGATWRGLWQEEGTGDGGYAATFLLADPRRPGRLLLGTNRGLRVSDDGGANWRAEDLAPGGPHCTAWMPWGDEEDLLGTDGHGLLRGTVSAEAPRVSDLAAAVRILRLCQTTPTPEDIAFGDRDGDGRITPADAILTLRIALGGS